ncbi:hypothetical protein BSK52_03610 [Paenibacillus odorifer]|uniref:Uncharacterized protein n=1 Tax=Paenibacillus odorifer TaxID=189426 RepID=A0A1R0Y816_9BACL|nr:hypothetical protein BSK52_03610 [Paenibacillus odorifer]
MPGRQSQYSALRHQNEMSIIPDPWTGLMGQTNPFEMTVRGMEEPSMASFVRLRTPRRHAEWPGNERKRISVGKSKCGRCPLQRIDML